MRANAVYIVGGMVGGMLLMGLIVWFALPSVMVVKHRSPLSYDKTVEALNKAVTSKQDWRVLAVNDYQKSTADFGKLERVGSINVCNPRYAAKVLASDRDRGVTAFMPLGIGVYEDKDGKVSIVSLNVTLLGKMFGGTVAEVMGRDAGKDLNDAIASVASE